MSKVAVIIVNWNTGTLLRECVASVLTIPEQDLVSDIIVVDSASSDQSVAELEKWLADHGHTSVQIIRQNENIGFARGNNVAIRLLQQRYGANLPHVLLLNPDTVIPAGTIAALQQELEHEAAVGIVGPTLENADASLQSSVRRFPTPSVILAFLLKLPRLVRHHHFWQHYLAADMDYHLAQDVDQVMGAAFLIRADLLRPEHPQSVGLLDERFFVWWEEVDYCQRAKGIGWRVRYLPTPPVRHYGGVSFAQLIGVKRTLPWATSLVHYTRKHMSVVTLALVMLPRSLLLAGG